jgi:hypothetical protein
LGEGCIGAKHLIPDIAKKGILARINDIVQKCQNNTSITTYKNSSP